MRTFDRSLVLDTSLAAIVPTAQLFSFYLLFAGHNQPGGGFIGGLVAGAAIVLRWLSTGDTRLRGGSVLSPTSFLGVGLMIAVVTGVAGWAYGTDFLESAKVQLDLPVLGTLKATTALVFDVGVYLVVIGLVLAVLDGIGGEQPERFVGAGETSDDSPGEREAP